MPDPEVQHFGESAGVVNVARRPLRFRGVTVRPLEHTRVIRFSECATMAKKYKKFADCTPKTQGGMKKFADAPEDAAGAPEGISRADMLEMLSDYGVDPSVTEGMDDDELAEMLRVLSSQAPDTPAEPASTQMDGSNELRGKNQAGQLAAINAKDPEGDYHPSKHTYADNTSAVPVAPTATGLAPSNPAVSQQNMAQPTSVTHMVKYSEQQIVAMNAWAEALEKRLAALDKISGDRVADEKKAGFQVFCESQVKAGKLLPAWIDAGLIEVAMELDAVKVHKFSDGKQVTALDKLKAIITSGPNLLHFSERLANGKSGSAAADHEENRVKQHYHSFAENYKKQGLDEEKLVAGFRALKKRMPDTRAEDYLGAGVA
jgi:hypothetical protein